MTDGERVIPARKQPREFYMGRVHIPPTRDWSLYFTVWGFQFELNLALPPKEKRRGR